MTASTRRRLLKELDDMSHDTSSGVHASIVDSSNIMRLQGQFSGPPDSPYEGGTYLVDIQLPDNYPFLPPKMKFITKVWHPNVSSQTGAICLDTLATKWSPVLTIKTALISLQSLLSTPEPEDPQDAQVASQLKSNPEAFRRTAKQWAIQYAGAPANGDSAALKEVYDRQIAYKGYKKEVVERFVEMGLSVEEVVKALEKAGIKKFEVPTEEQMNTVAASMWD